MRDTSDRSRLWQQLVEAQKMESVGRLAGGVAHDFNNILAVIMGNAELVQDVNDDQRTAVYLNEIVDAARRGGSLTRSLLNFSQRSTVSPTRVDLNEEIKNALPIFERTSLKKAVLTVNTSDAALCTNVDKDQLQSVFINLLINANDAIDPGDTINVSTYDVDTESDPRLVSKHDLSEGRYGVVEIADSGSGIPAEVLSRVTEPFFTTKNRAEGSGLGLSMALGFARQSGGNLVVESTHKSGTTVKVFFPLVDQPVEKAAEPEQSAHFGHQTQVLLLEDDYTVQAMLRAQLQNVGFKVTTLETGKQALQALECSVFDIAWRTPASVRRPTMTGW